MKSPDVIVIGNGLAGAALSYELAKAGQSVLLMDDSSPDSGTRYSYGGISSWAGTNDLTETLFKAGRDRHLALPDELGADTQFRDIDLLLTVKKGADVESLIQAYTVFRTAPEFVSAQSAQAIEPQLAATQIEGAFTIRQGHVDPMSLVAAYNQAFRRLGGHHNLTAVTGLVRIGDRITGITTAAQAYAADRVVVAAGAYSQQLIQAAKLQVPLFFTHAEIIETPPLEIEMRSQIMPATNARFKQEAEAAANPQQWQKPDTELLPTVLEAGIIQFQNKTARIGQISRFHTAYTPPADPSTSALALRDAIAQQVPNLQSVAGTWRHCLVTFTQDGLPLLGPVPHVSGLHLFSGFTSPFALIPPIAQRYAQYLTAPSSIGANTGANNGSDEYIEQMLITRFSQP